MKRTASVPRPDWREKFDALGFNFHSMDGGYWDESVCYEFSSAEIDILEDASKTVHELCLVAVDHVIKQHRYSELHIPETQIQLIEQSWKAREPSLYGRFDFTFDGTRPPKLLEYNADTPTSVIEAAVAQWHWLEETGKPDQFNSLHDKLIDRWKKIAGTLPIATPIHFSCLQSNMEDCASIEYLRDVAMQAGIETHLSPIEEIGWNGKAFVDVNENLIRAWFKLYPWEWLMQEEFGVHLENANIRVIEPPWKAILSNKGILPILWELFPNHENLLAAYKNPDPLGNEYAKKPIHSREGANIILADKNRCVQSKGPYTGDSIYQKLESLPNFSGNYPVIGSWIVGDDPAGIGIREDNSPITSNSSRFIPHYFL